MNDTKEQSPQSIILTTLLHNAGIFVPGERLVKAAGISRAGVWKHIAALRKQGFGINAGIRKGYCLKEVPDRLYPELVQNGLATDRVGRGIYYYQSIDSTNRVAKDLAVQGVADGALVVAEEQTRGKGRMDRTWISPGGENILCSLILYPALQTAAIFRLTMLASVAVVHAIQNVCGIEARIKWPNDVYIGNKKVCGVLTEFLADHDVVRYVVIGIGLNVNLSPAGIPEIKDIATSLGDAAGRTVSRTELLQELLRQVDVRYGRLSAGSGDELRREWEEHSLILDKEVTIVSGEESRSGIARGITADGHLVLEEPGGKRCEIVCGDLSLRW